MAGFPKKDRQRIVDDYLSETGRNMYVPVEFVEWLQDKPDHVAYPWFYNKSDEEWAIEGRLDLARKMVSGLRITVREEENKSAKVVGITVREYPAYLSPMDARKTGGGYERFDPQDVAQVSELKRQGMSALKAWLNRYGASFGDTALPVYKMVEEYEEERAAHTA